MKPILEIQNISKKYKLRGQETPYLTIRDAILGKNKRQKIDEFWALKDITFDVYPGESVGIIGKNGAGKSTLLKILSKITPPTEGQIIARGRISSLLEVGTGFHEELTGMENIYLNGSILGLRKAEIKKKLDEIIDFSGVEKFIDTPLKHYSSGMQLRLAFAVAAHLEPEILIVDEVLAVGDAEFQKKSLGKMEDITHQGRTVIFVSHNMGAVKSLCTKGVLLANGNLMANNSINSIVNLYLNENGSNNYTKIEFDSMRKGNGQVIFSDVYFEDENFKKIDTILTGQDVYFVFVIKVNQENISKVDIDFSIHNEFEDPLIVTRSSYQNVVFNFRKKGYYIIKYKYSNFNIAPGIKNIRGLILVKNEILDWPINVLNRLNIEMGDFYLSGFTSINNRVQFLNRGEWLSS